MDTYIYNFMKYCWIWQLCMISHVFRIQIMLWTRSTIRGGGINFSHGIFLLDIVVKLWIWVALCRLLYVLHLVEYFFLIYVYILVLSLLLWLALCRLLYVLHLDICMYLCCCEPQNPKTPQSLRKLTTSNLGGQSPSDSHQKRAKNVSKGLHRKTVFNVLQCTMYIQTLFTLLNKVFFMELLITF